MNTMFKNVDIKKHANLINKVDSKLAEINSLTKEVYPNKNLDDVLEKVLDKIEYKIEIKKVVIDNKKKINNVVKFEKKFQKRKKYFKRRKAK